MNKKTRERDENKKPNGDTENNGTTQKTKRNTKTHRERKKAIRFLIDKVVENLELNGLVYINRGATASS